MANSGVGNKFVSTNLNKSYGQHSHHLSSHSSSYGSSRTRPSGHGSGGGSMVVLSRPRSSQKAGPKLSVPPPLNLPSLRKEHERFDSLGLGSGPTGGVVSGSGSRPTSSGMGWAKPAAVALQEKESFGEQTVDGFDQGLRPVDGFSRGSTVYMPPSARSGVVGAATPTSVQAHPTAEKAAVLRGEDFPSLRATLSSASGPPQKLKENLNQKQKQLAGDNLSSEQKDGSRLSSLVDTHSQFHLSHASVGNGLTKDGSESHSFRSSRAASHARKQEEYFPGPLPLVRLNPRSDWADDERDTSHGLTDRSREGRDHGFSKNEAYWDRDFDMPRLSALPHKPTLNFDKRGPHHNETGKITSGEVPELDPCVRTASREGREGNSWRNSSFTKDGSLMQDVGNVRNGVAVRPSSMNREVGKDNTYIASPFQENVHEDFGKKDLGYALRGRQPWNDAMESYGGRGPELSARDRYFGNEQHNRYSINSVQRSVSKSSFSLGGKGLSTNDPLLTFNSGKHTLPKSEKAFLEDPFMKDFGASGFDGKDMFSAGLGVVKKKKDVLKQTDFHDPVRESFEAELERVQRMQEQERQRITEEQERALELARREEEDRLRQVREQEERQRRLEEEAREAAWRAEQEQIEALRKAEEQRIAREEEKKRIIVEEERRKEAAKQKLLELEERIARRQAEAAKGGNNSSIVADEKMSRIAKEKDASKPTDMGDWDDSERVVERIITLASSDSSSLNRPLEIGSRPHFYRDISSTFVDRGKSANSWRRDVYENEKGSVIYQHDQDNRQNTLRRDSQIGGKPLMKKEYYGGAEFMTSRTTHKGGLSEAHLNEYADVKGQRWNQLGVGDHLRRNTEIDSDFHDNFVERFGDGGTQGRSRGNSLPPYPEHASPNSESDEAYVYGRSRYSVRQPRVLPPPSITSVHKSYRNGNGRPGPSAFLENEIQYDHAARSESILPTGYDRAYKGNPGQSEVVGALIENNENENYKVEWNTIAMCDSQSSLSVSSPPSSPTHLSHDDLDEYGVSPAVLASGEGKNVPLSGPKNESAVLPPRAGNENEVNSSCAISVGDDEEWTTEINEQFQEQEEYDEDEDYQEEYEVRDRDDNVDLNQEFEDMNLEEKGLPHMMDNLILGFDEGVQVGMPNEEFEGTLEEETSFIPQVSGSTLKEQVSFCNSCSDGEALEPVNSSPVNLNGSSSVFQESEKPTQYLVIKPSNSHTSMASENLDNVEAYNDDLAAHHTVPTSVTADPYFSSDQTNMSNAATASSQVELPVKLQFGLFSGPSLIPSPVPAIQIGSIQMPLHVHPHFGVPHSHMHSSQPPLFQFGQLRYTSPISQGMMPLGSQSTSFIQPNIPSSFSFTHNPGGPMPLQTGPDTIDGFIKTEIRSHPVDNQTGNSRHVNLSQGSLSCKNSENVSGIKQDQIGIPHDGNVSTKTCTGFEMEEQGRQSLVVKSSNTLSNARESEGQPNDKNVSLQLASKEKDFEESEAQFPVVGGRGKRYAFTVKSSGSGSSGPPPRVNHQDTSGFLRRRRRNIQRTEFRVRDSAEKRVSSGLWHRKALSNKVGKQAGESACLSSATDNLQDVDPGGRVDGKESTKIQSISHSGLNHLKRNFCSGEVVDAPLQSGIIRVFEQPGIEASNDEDDFIEVRSKRQMLNDRREQREREIKAKSRVAKMSQKPRSTLQANCSKPNVSIGEPANQCHSDFVSSEGRRMAKIEVSSGFNSGTMSLSQPLAPIGTPSFKIDAQPDLRSQTSSSLPTSLPAVSGGGKNPRPGVLFESKNKALDNVQTSMGPWDNTRISQQVMALAQRQLDEAMKPQQFDSRASPGELTATVTEPGVPTSSLLTRKKPFSTAASAINSLLAGEKIQFGAVTSPTVLPTSSHAVSHGVGPPRSSRSDMQISHNLAGCDNDCSLFFDKDKHSDESGGRLEDCEAEAEAAASAVAVAAISIDEIVENGLGASSVSVSDCKGLGAADIEGIAAGVGCSQQSDSQSRSEEPLSVSLPADLSVETPPISLWPPLPSLQNSSSQMLMHFHGGPPHFPFYEMNPMIGGPVFAFGPHDESAPATQPQSQESSTTASGPIRGWQQCHSGVDSFCGPPAGFTGPFITPPGGIPGIQGPPHMVVYNHFAPFGQFGQAGLSFMGATYISSGKQPDWKHNPTSSAMGAGEGDMNNMNMAPLQQNPANMPTPYQHLAPGSPLLPIASPLAMFDASPFQSSLEMSVQARWPNVPNSPHSSIPVPMPLQEGLHTSPCNHGSSVDHLISINKFPTSQTSTPDGDRNFPNRADVNVNHLPDELGLVDPSNSTAAQASGLSTVVKTQPVSTTADAGKVDVQNGNDSNSSNQNQSSSQPSQQNNISTKQYDHSSGYTNYQRGGVSQKNSSGGAWSHRRMGFHGKNQTLGADKSFTSSKVKQIYVAKQTRSGTSMS